MNKEIRKLKLISKNVLESLADIIQGEADVV